jgi:hypothetical protein
MGFALAQILQREPCHHFVDAGADLGGRQSEVLQAERDVLFNGGPDHLALRVLKEDAGLPSGSPPLCRVTQVVAAYIGPFGSTGFFERRNDSRQRGLPRAVGTYNGHVLALGYREVDAPQSLAVAAVREPQGAEVD